MHIIAYPYKSDTDVTSLMQKECFNTTTSEQIFVSPASDTDTSGDTNIRGLAVIHSGNQ
jgi:hypothetical protein